MFVRVTYENAQSAGLAVDQYLKVKTGVLQCTTGDPTNDTPFRERIDTLLLDVTPDMVHVRLSHRLQYAAKFLGAHQAMTALHKAHAKARRLQEPAMDVTEKMMQWDADDPLLQPKSSKPDPDCSATTLTFPEWQLYYNPHPDGNPGQEHPRSLCEPRSG